MIEPLNYFFATHQIPNKFSDWDINHINPISRIGVRI